MKNRDWLLKTAAVDVLTEINKPMLAYQCNCIMDALADEGCERCRKHEGKCRDCIAAWLDEERR